VIKFDLASLSIAPPPLGTKRIQIDIFGQIRPFTLSTAGPTPAYNNLGYLIEDGPGDLVCEQSATTGNNGTVVDTDDVFGISATDICKITRDYDVPITARFAGQKWSRNENDPTNIVLAPGLSGTCEDATVVTDGQLTESNYTRNPCVHEGDVGDIFTYRLTVQNTGNISLYDYHLYDLLPYEGDTGVNLVGSPRGSNWRPVMTSNGVGFSDSGLMTDAPSNTLLDASDFVIEYSDSRIPCRPEVGITTSCDTATWSTDPITAFGSWSDVESFRIVLDPGIAWEPGIQVEFLVEMEIPIINYYDTNPFTPSAGTTNPAAGIDTTQNPEVGHVAWNNFAHNFYETNNTPVIPGDLLSVAEPPRVGILIPEFGSIGNFVFFDDDNNRRYEPASGETGVENVIVELYADTDGSGVFDAPDLLVGTTTTINPQTTDSSGNPGYYLFDNLAEGDYFVHLPASNFVLAGPLFTYISSFDTIPVLDSFINNIDHGIDDFNPATNGITSPMININFDNELISDDGPGNISSDSADGPYRRGNQHEENNSSDLTVDFGFFIPMSIGNQVWHDTNNNALLDSSEDGINGVLVQETTTNANGVTSDGYYIFDALPEGDYIVRLAALNFNPGGMLVNGANEPFSSSESGGIVETIYLFDNQTDDNDNGIDEDFPQINGIVSNIINLSYFQEPDGDTIPAEDINAAPDDTNLDLDGSAGVSGEGRFGERDDNAEMTIDFSVYSPIMSIGNRVFKDYDNNRILDGADVGVDDVVVNLFFDSDQNGIPDSGINNPIATTTTAAGGYYLFDGLNTDYYLVQIDEVNFRTTGNGTLRDYYSSQDKATPTDTAGVIPTDNENDTIEDGIDNPFNPAQNPDPQAEGVFSPTIHLEPSNEPATETDLGPEGNGEPNIQASNSDLTIDFGFYQPMSLGNHVWFDTNNDGLLNGAEAGIAGVQVELYLETDGTPSALDTAADTLVPVFDGTNYVNFDTTDANGFYLFDNLAPGQYWVHIPASDFGSGNVLFNHISTQPNNESNPTIAPAPITDSNDNGTPDDGSATTLGVTSEIETLGVIDPVNGSGLYIPDNSEPVNEINKSNNPPAPSNTYDGPVSIGRYGELDNNSDVTIDFGFILADSASMSIGNRVWFDTNRNGLIDTAGDDNPLAPGDPGIDGVTVLLYRADVSGNPIGGPIARDITDNGGYYLFDVLDTDAATATDDGDGLGGPVTPGNYVVAIPNSDFLSGGPLETYTSTDTGIDNDGSLPPSTLVELGYSAGDDDNNDNGTSDATYGVLSNLITLTLQAERDDEDVANKEVGVLDGTDATLNPIAFNNSDLTVDFGFYLPMSLGNFVWVDLNNNGVYDSATEYPVPDGVLLELFESDGTTPIPNPAFPVLDYQVTTNNGFYLFDELPPGDYVVRLIDLNFLPTGLLEGYLGSDNGSSYEDDTDNDQNDNGRDIATPATSDGIPSGIITLAYNTEPLSEATSGNPADGPDGRGNNGELDANSNLTVDFGVYPTTYFSIGNRVWIDNGAGANEGNGVHDSDELGVANSIIDLFRDENDGAAGPPDGIPDSTTPIASTTTDVDGYYLFDSLASGNYIVSVAPANFQSGGVLRGYSATLQTDATESMTDHLSDQVNISSDINFGYYSATYTLGPGPAEPTGEIDPTPAGAAQDPGTDPFGTPIPDDQSNLTVDFGFIPTLSLGNILVPK